MGENINNKDVADMKLGQIQSGRLSIGGRKCDHKVTELYICIKERNYLTLCWRNPLSKSNFIWTSNKLININRTFIMEFGLLPRNLISSVCFLGGDIDNTM